MNRNQVIKLFQLKPRIQDLSLRWWLVKLNFHLSRVKYRILKIRYFFYFPILNSCISLNLKEDVLFYATSSGQVNVIKWLIEDFNLELPNNSFLLFLRDDILDFGPFTPEHEILALNYFLEHQPINQLLNQYDVANLSLPVLKWLEKHELFKVNKMILTWFQNSLKDMRFEPDLYDRLKEIVDWYSQKV